VKKKMNNGQLIGIMEGKRRKIDEKRRRRKRPFHR